MIFKKKRKYTNINPNSKLSLYEQIDSTFYNQRDNFNEIKVHRSQKKSIFVLILERIVLTNVLDYKKNKANKFGAQLAIKKENVIITELMKNGYDATNVPEIKKTRSNWKTALFIEKSNVKTDKVTFYRFFQFKYYQYFIEKNFPFFTKYRENHSQVFNKRNKRKDTASFYHSKYTPIKTQKHKYAIKFWKKRFFRERNKQSYKVAFLLLFKKKKKISKRRKVKKKISFRFKSRQESIKLYKIKRKTFKSTKNIFHENKEKIKRQGVIKTNPILGEKNKQNSPTMYDFKNKKIKKRLSNLSGFESNIMRINLLAFARFEFDYEKNLNFSPREKKFQNKNRLSPFRRKKKDEQISSFIYKNKRSWYAKKNHSNLDKTNNSNNFLKALEKESEKRYQYDAIEIKNIVRIIFIAVFSKNAQLIASFFSLIFHKLPRNRKETKFILIFSKIRKIIATQRQEVTGTCRRFQGRINRWDRTNHIVEKKGNVKFNTYNQSIAYGRAQGITRKGAFGIRIWIGYEHYFSKKYEKSFYAYRNNFEKKKTI